MQEMLEKHQKNENWTNVRVIGVCIDQENMPLVMQKRVADRKWNLIEHFGSGTSKVENLFEVEEVPYFVLVDKQGMIAWAGNPGSRDIEHDIRSLVNNRGIQVRAENEEPRDEDYVSMNQAFMSVENFKHDTAQLAQELKSLAKKCPRAFLRLENVTVCDLQDFG